MTHMRWGFALVLALLCMPGIAQADELRPGYLEFTQTTNHDWELVWKAPLRTGITPLTQPLLPQSCALAGNYMRSRANLAVIARADVRCSESVEGQSIGLSHMDTSQTDILVRVAPLGRPVQTFRLTPDEPRATILARAGTWQVARTYFIIGVEHIIFGYDHMLFVVALVLLLGRFWTIAKAATAFTLAHSITLVGTTVGFFGLPQAPVEAVIALSIVFLAVEIVKQRPGTPRLSERIPWLVAFLFGLLHGFGFAGALRDIGLPENDVPMALITFNLGVEAGQLVIVAIALAAIMAIRRFAPKMLRPTTLITTYGIGAIASMWLIERVILN